MNEQTTEQKTWENYGDVTPAQGGCYVKEFMPGVYDVVKVVEYFDTEDENKSLVIESLQFDVDDFEDSWIVKDEVMSFIGMTEENFSHNPIYFGLGCIDYYGAINFGSSEFPELLTEDEMLDRLKSIGCIDSSTDES